MIVACEFPETGHDARYLAAVLNVLADASADWFREHGDRAECCPGCAGLVYSPPARGSLRFSGDPQAMLGRGRVGCAGAAVWRAGYLRAAGELATIELEELEAGDWHAVVRRADGTREDPTQEMRSTC